MVYAQLGDREKARKALALAVNSPATFHGRDDARKALAGLQ
jgi:hypothetical protein